MATDPGTPAATNPTLALRRPAAAKALSMGERTLAELTRKGLIPCVRVGRKCVLYRVADLERFLADRAEKGAGHEH